MHEGLDEEMFALFDLLVKPGLDKVGIQRIKKTARELLDTLKSERLRIDGWREKETSRNAIRVAILDFLWNDQTGLPVDRYGEDEVLLKADDVYRHGYRAYPTVPSPYYGTGCKSARIYP